ncbi:sulfite exporter TauE/SafE family protein [Candidatus Leptofilum sp.]|uniref:sulfite exporter TauE/SafE family protein n=1 Tax=Candidatus Leptofilum sp. TaxID=3241576 RepID=UPI003B5A6E7C
MNDWLVVALIIGLASVSQTAVGFGAPLIAMPVLVPLLGIQTATPLSTLAGLLLSILILLRFRQSFNFRDVIHLLLATLAGVPVGVALLNWVSADALTTLLGVLVIGYALYALLSLQLPKLEHLAWAYGFGFVAGVLGGALNTSAPSIVVYGSSRRWPPEAFRTNLQGYFLMTNTAILIAHGLDGNLTAPFWRSSVWSLSGIVAGFLVGLWLANRINPDRFKRLVLLLLLVLGLNLLF